MFRYPLLAFATALTILVCPTVAASQSLSIGGRLGLYGGAVWFEDSEATDVGQPIPGLQVGGVAAYRASSIMALQAEVWFVQKAWTETQSGGGRRLSYLEVPLLLALTAPWKTAPQLLAGVSLGLEVACAVTGVDVGSVSCDAARVEWHRTKTQVGTWFGLGLATPLGRGTLNLQVLGNLNITSVNDETLPRGFARLFGAAVSAAYLIPFGGR